MATITSINNTTAGTILNVHDTTTWIGGVVPGPNDVVVFQSAAQTRFQIRQNWTIQNMTFSASTNRSNTSYLEIPDNVTGNVTFTQTQGTWSVGTTWNWANAGEVWAGGYFMLVNNPVGTTSTLNIPGGIGYANGANCAPDGDSAMIEITAKGNVYVNTPLVTGFALNHCNGNWRKRNGIQIQDAGGYVEINVTGAIIGYHNYSQCSYSAGYWGGIGVWGLQAGGVANVRINAASLQWSQYGYCWNDQHAPAINVSGNLGTHPNAVTINITGANGWSWYRGPRGIVYFQHTAGNVRCMGADMNPSTGASETWPTIGYNENNDAGGSSGVRRILYSDTAGGGSTNRSFVSIYCNVYGPNNNYSTQTASGNWSNVFSGGMSVKMYGNVYTSPKNRFQVPFYFDNRQSFYYGMAGTVYTSINHAVYFNTLASNTLYPIEETPGMALFSGGLYFGNTVSELDILGNIYAVNTNPYICPAIAPNPFYQSGAGQVQWTFRRHWDDRSTTSSIVHADFTDYSPLPANVRLGTVYGGGTKTGTLAVPQPFQVALGVATDNTVGTWTGVTNVIDAAGIASEVWNYNLGNITNTTTGAGKRLTNTATIESTGQQIAALGV